jgi:hypothetical protein
VRPILEHDVILAGARDLEHPATNAHDPEYDADDRAPRRPVGKAAESPTAPPHLRRVVSPGVMSR